LIFLAFLFRVSDFCFLPMATLPDLDMLQNSLLSAEVSRWIQSYGFGNHRGKTFEAENYDFFGSAG